MDEYRTAFDQLNIPQEVFDQIITDDAARGEIHEFLIFCLTSVPSLSSIASVLLQYIAASVSHDDGGPGSGNFGHSGVPGQVGGSAPSGITAVSDSCFPTDRYRIDPNQGWNAERSSYLSGKGFSDGAIKKLSDLTTAHIRGQEPEAEMKKFISENRDLVMAAASYETAAAQKRREYEIAEADKAIASAKEELEAVNRGEYDWMGPREYALQDAEDRLRSCESHRKKLDEPVKLYRKGGYEDTCLSFTTDYNGVVLNAGTDYETYLTPDHEATLQELESQGIFPIGGFGAYFNFYSGEGTEVTFVRVPTVNQDGGPGSGNHGHEGRPGEKGGSLPSGKTFNDRMKEAYNYKANGKNYWDVGVEMRKCIQELPAGGKFTMKGTEYTKDADGKYHYTFWGSESIASENEIVNLIDPFDPAKCPQFFDPQSEDVAEEKVESGDLDPSDTTVSVPQYEAEPFKGRYGCVDVTKEEVENLRQELQRNTKENVDNETLNGYLTAVDAYRGSDYTDLVAASADFSGLYDEYSSSVMRDPQKREQALQQVERLERFMESADKYEGKVMRAMGFDLGGDFDGGKQTDALNSLLERCQPGKVVDMGHISSWTTSNYTINQILDARSGIDETAEHSVEVVLTCKNSKSGVDIGRFSKQFTQGEVAFSKKQQFRVKTVKRREIDDEVTRYDIELEEAEP